MIHLEPECLELVRKILRVFASGRTVWIFGSRVTGKIHPASDIDLAIMGDKPLSLSEEGDLRYAFEASRLPYRVDLVDWARTSESFRKIIEANHEVVQTGET